MTVVSIILVDKRIQDYETIVTALKHDVVTSIVFDVLAIDTAICQDTNTTSFQYILNKIAEIGVGTITNVGIVQHNTGAPFHRFFSRLQGEESVIASVETADPTLQSWAEFAGFITSLKNTYGVQNVDLMACALYSNPNWKYVIDTLAKQTGVALRASTDDTGAEALGGDWFLESHTGVNLKDVYFTEAIENYQGVLFWTNKSGYQLYNTKSITPGNAIAWGYDYYGGDTTMNAIGGSLSSNIIAVYGNTYAFAALRTNGSVVTWGDNSSGAAQQKWSGGAVGSVAASLTAGVTKIYMNSQAMTALKSDGTVVTWGNNSYGGNSSTVTLTNVVDIYSNQYVFAALKSDGSVQTWGSSSYGSDSSTVTSSINSNVVSVNMGYRAGAVLKKDGSVITWGDTTYGGNSSSVSSSLSSGVVVIYTDNEYTYAALKNNGSIVVWGQTAYGGNPHIAASSVNLTNVVSVCNHTSVYAALKLDGSVVTWGITSNGTSTAENVTLSTAKIVKICSSSYSFAALTSTGNVITWGYGPYGGDSSAVTASITDSNVVAIYSTTYAYAALKKNGQVITWGNSTNGGNSTSVANDISANVVAVYSTQSSFAALRKDGKVIVWGYTLYGGASNVYIASTSGTKSIAGGNLNSGITAINNTVFAFAAIQNTIATSFDLSASYYTDNDRYDILRNKENRRRTNLTTLNNNVFTLSSARDIERFNYTIPNDTGPFRIIIPDYVDTNYSITSTVTVPGGASINYIIACDEGEPIIISGVTYINYGGFVYLRNADNTFTKITTTTISSITYHLYGGDGINSSGIALRYRIGPFAIPSKTYGDASFNITEPISYTSGAFTYTSSNTAVATVTSAGTVTINGPGTTTITATRPGGAASDVAGITNSSVIKASSATTNRTWRAISLSNTGEYQTAVTKTSGYIYTSSNYGITWTERTAAGAREWNSISLSSTGEYQTAVATGGKIYTSSNYGVTWTERSVVKTWLSVSISNTGQYQTAAGSSDNIWTSSDYGVTWTGVTTLGNKNWRSVSVSGTGEYQTAVAGSSYIYTSSDYGVTWTERTTTGTTQAWEAVSISDSGRYQSAVIQYGGIYTSSDYGASWTQRNAGSRNWYSISLSNTGQYQTAVHYQGSIWVSSDYGITWSPRATNMNWNSVSLSETGEFQSAVITGGQIYFSTNYGFTWSNIASYELMSVTTTLVTNKAAPTLSALTIPTKVPGDIPFTLTPPTSSVSSIISPTYTITNTASLIIPPPSSSINSLTYGGGWYQEGGNIIGDSTGELCGYSTSMSADGTIIAVGYISATQPSSGISSSGRVRVFKSDITKTTANALGPAGWTQLGGDIYGEAASDRGGWRVALSADGTVVAISADSNDGTSGTVNTNVERGHVRVYRYTPSKTLAVATQTDSSFGPVGWTRMGADIDGQSAGDIFGSSLSISADGNIIAVGAPSNKGPSGTAAAMGQVRIFRYTPNKLAVTDVNDVSFGPAGWTRIGSDIYGDAAGDQEGRSIALSADGNSFVTGATYGRSSSVAVGRVRTYIWNGTQWNKRGSDIMGINSVDLFGTSVAISANGNIIAGAARQGDGNSIVDNGSVRVYYWNTNTNDWTQQGGDIYGEAQSDDSGWSISLSADGTIIAIGAYRNDGTSGTADTGDNRGHVRIYKYDVNKTQAQLLNQGLANFGPVGWNMLNSDIDGSAASNNFGQSVSLSSDGTRLVVGEPNYTEGGVSQRGRARVFYISTTNAITYTSSNSSVADICGNLLLIKGVNGTSTITASQTGNIVTGRLDVIGTSYTLQYNPFTYTSSNTSVATVSTYGTITLTGAIGTSTITAIQPETLLYVSRNITETLDVSGTVTVLSGFNIPAKMLGDTSFNISPPSSNNTGGTFTYTSSNTSVATVTSDGVVTINGIGTTTITAFQSASGIYSTASISGSLIVNFGNTNTITRIPTDGAYVIPTPISDVSTTYGSLWNKLGADIVGKVAGDESGTSVSISADGTIVAIGSRSNTTNRGTVRIYKFNDISWVQIGTDINGETSSDYSGQSVSLSANGRIVAIGANMNDGSGNLLPDSGHVRIYEYNGANWVQRGGDIDGEANGDQSGISVSLSEDGNIVAIGAIMNDGSGNLLSNSGHVRVYKYNSLKSAPQLTNQNLSTFGPAGWDRLGGDIDGETVNDQSGFSVSLSADGTIIAIGAIFNDGTSGTVDTSNNRGHVRVYRYNSIKTEPQLTNQNLSTFGPARWDRLGADIDGEAAADQSGFSVSLSADGSTLAIGSPYYDPSGVSNAGRVRVFAWNGTSWMQRGENINGITLNENIGDSISLSANGTILSVSSFMKVVNYNYNSSTNTWNQIGSNITGAALSETNIVNALVYSPHVYLDATNSSSYNGSTWTNLGSLGGNAVITYMGAFDANDNGGSFNFNGSTHYGQLTIPSTTLTSLTYVAVIKSTGLNTGYASIIDFGNDNLLLCTLNNVLIFYNPGITSSFTLTAGVWYVVAVTITTGGTITFYVNGVSILTGSVAALTGRTNTVYGIGSGISGPNEAWNGKISALAIYHNRVLTASEIANLSNKYQTYRVNLSSQGNILAIGAREYDGVTGTSTNIGVTRVYRIDTSGNYTFSINNNAIADICGNIILPKSSGSTTIAFTQSASGGTASRSGTIPLILMPTPTFQPYTIESRVFGDVSFNLTDPSSNSTGNFTFTSSDTSVATISGRTVTVIGVGTTTITATQAADVNYASSSIAALFTVAPITTVIGEFTISSKTYGTDTSFNLVDPSSNSPAVFTYTSSNAQVATISGRTVTIVGPGTSIITASQASGNYSSADVSGSLIVNFGFTNTISRVLRSGGYVIPKPLSNVETTYGSLWTQLGADIDGEAVGDQSGYSVSISADGTVVAIGALMNDGTSGNTDTGVNCGHVRVYKYTPNKTLAVTNQNDLSFGPIGWTRIGEDIDGVMGLVYGEQLGNSVSLSADGTVIAIGAVLAGGSEFTGPSGVTKIYSWNGTAWVKRGGDIYGERANDYSGKSVSISADGTVVAIGAINIVGPVYGINSNSENRGYVRVFKYNPNKTTSIYDQNLSTYGPVGWDRLGKNITGEWLSDNSGRSVSLSADGTILAIGAENNDGTGFFTDDDRGHVRVYKYNPAKTTAVTDQSLSTFGPAGWDRLGGDIDGETTGDKSGRCVSLSADGTTVAIGSINNDGSGNSVNNCGHVRVYRYNPNKSDEVSDQSLSTFGPAGWDRLGGDIDGDAESSYFGHSVSLSSDGNIIAIGAENKSPGGQVRIYKYRANKTTPQLTNQSATDFGPAGWDRIGGDINAEASADSNGYSVSLSTDGTTVAIGAINNDGSSGTQNAIGHVRIFRIDTSGNYTYTSNNSTIADVCGNIILAKNAGSTTIAFTQSASGGTASRSGTIPLVISRITPTFGAFTVPTKNFGDTSFNLSPPTSDSSGAFTYASSDNAVATVTPEGTVTIIGVGTTTITATQAASADGNYSSRDISGSLVVRASLSNFTVPANKLYGDVSFNLTDPDSTDNTVGFTFTSSNTNVATLDGRIVTIVGVGSTIITATQEATASRGQLDISATLIVSPRTPIITLDPIVKLYGNSSFRPQPSTTNTDISGGRVFTFTSDNIAVVSMLDASLVRINGVGTTTLRYTQAASANFTDASGTVGITVNKGVSGFSASTFAVATNKTYGDASFAITTFPIGSSTGAITYSSNDETVATIDNNGMITLVGQGTVTFTASQLESALYAADTKTSNILTVARKTVALSRNTPTAATITKYYGDASFSVIAMNESNGEISYTSSDPSFATIDISSGRVNIIALGSTTLTARREQTAQYNETDVSWSLTINRGQTTLTGLSSMTRNVTVAPFSVTASSASDGAVTYALQDPLSTVLTIHPTSGLVTLLSPGLATIVASQAQGTLYEAPPNITATITVTAASNTLEGATLTNTNNFTNVDLSGASLANTTITDTNFTSGRLNNAIFNGSNISNANMTLSELSNASLTNTTITNTTFVSGRLNNANLNGTTITGSNMTSTDLSGANIRSATINGTNFTSAILARTDLSGSTIRSSIFNNANLSGSTLTRIDASGSSFVNANLSNANLSNSDFTNANMTNANISGANLTNVSFTVPQKLQLLKNTNNRIRSEIQVSEVFGNVLLPVLSEGSAVRDVPNVSNARFKVMVPTTSSNVNDTIPNIVLDISNYGYFYLPVGENEYFQIENIRYYIVGSTIRNYLTGAVVENLTYGVKAIRLIAGSLTVVVNSINTLSTTSFIVPSYKLNTDLPFSPTTLPTSNSSAPIVYTSSNTGIATIDSSSGIITPVAGACGFVTFTASQVATETHESASIRSNELFVNRLIDLALPGLNQSFTLSEYAALDTAAISPENTDATAVIYVRLSDMKELFQYHTDSNDINDISASDIKYYVFHRKLPTEIKLNPSHAMMNKTESYGMYGNFQDFTQDKSLVKHDFIRYIALRLFNTFHGVDLFQNETELHENITYLGETVQHNINLILSEISTTSSSGTMAIDASGNKYLTNDASGNTNLCRELMRQIAASNPSRLYDNNQNYSGIRPVPLLENDSINFKVTITPASGQNMLTGVSVIPARTYMIKLVLKNTVNTVTNTNTKVTDSEMYPNAYSYSSSVVTYTPTLDSSNVYHIYSPPAPIPYARFGYNGWYYTNTTEWINVAPSVRDRIKWTVAANTASSTVADLQYIRMTLKVFNKTSLPFIIVYTSSGSYRKYTISTPNAIVNGTVYSFYINFNAYSREPAIIGATNAELTYSGVSSGSFASNEVISSITVETDNTAVASSIEFTLSSIIIGDTSGEKEHGFSAGVIDSYP